MIDNIDENFSAELIMDANLLIRITGGSYQVEMRCGDGAIRSNSFYDHITRQGQTDGIHWQR
jgi:hypothetical protein